MKNRMMLLAIMAMGVLLYSCKKDKDSNEPEPPVTYPDYSMLKVGNYWIYQEYSVDSLGNAIPKNIFDSCYVEKDSLFYNQTFYKVYKHYFNHPDYYYVWLRDSLHYIISPGNRIIFSSQDFTTRFYPSYFVVTGNDTMYHRYYMMTDKDKNVTVPAGNFVTSDFRMNIDYYPKYVINGAHRFIHTRYAENVGVVVETNPFFFSDPNYIERRLVRYHVK